jgi:hypothetical protein
MNTPPRPDTNIEPQLGRSWSDLSAPAHAIWIVGAIAVGFFALMIWIGWF